MKQLEIFNSFYFKEVNEALEDLYSYITIHAGVPEFDIDSVIPPMPPCMEDELNNFLD